MQKVPGVTTVKVSLNDGLTILDFAANNTVTLAQLRQVIRNNGFVTKEAKVIAAGSLAVLNGTITFEMIRSKERITVISGAGSNSLDAIRARLKGSERLDVEVNATVDLSDPKQLKMTIAQVTAR
jgi:hypothetical protein